MNAFANYAAKQLRTYETSMYDAFANVCDKVIAGNEDAIFAVAPLIRNAQMDILREQEHLYICFTDECDEYNEACEVFDAYINEEIFNDSCNYGIPYHFPKKFFDEVYMFFKYTDEGKKCMKEFNPNTNKIVEVTNTLL